MDRALVGSAKEHIEKFLLHIHRGVDCEFFGEFEERIDFAHRQRIMLWYKIQKRSLNIQHLHQIAKLVSQSEI